MDGHPGDLDPVVRRFFARLDESRRVPAAELEALVRLGDLDGEAAGAIRAAVADGRLFGAGVRDLVGRHALRGRELGAFILRDVLGRPLGEAARALGCDARTVHRRLAAARTRLGLPADAGTAVVGQWIVTELIAPPVRAMQLHLFRTQGENHDGWQGTIQGEDRRQAGLAIEEGEPWP